MWGGLYGNTLTIDAIIALTDDEITNINNNSITKIVVNKDAALTLKHNTDITLGGSITNNGELDIVSKITVNGDIDGIGLVRIYANGQLFVKGEVAVGGIYCNGIADLGVLNLTNTTNYWNFNNYGTVKVNNSVKLPTKTITQTATNFDITLGDSAKILSESVIGVASNNITVSKYDHVTGITVDSKQIEDLLKVTISDIADDEDANKSENILDITGDSLDFDPTINTTEKIDFTILTTQSIGITIGKDASITGTLNIRLKL